MAANKFLLRAAPDVHAPVQAVPTERSGHDSVSRAGDAVARCSPDDFTPIPFAHIRIGFMRHLPELVSRLNGDFDVIAAPWGMDRRVFADPLNVVRYATLSNLLAAAARETHCDAIGLELGMTATVDDLGPVAPSMRRAESVGEALAACASRLAWRDNGGTLQMTVQDDEATLSYLVCDPETDLGEQLSNIAVGAMYAVLRELVGPRWQANSVDLARRPPGRAGRFRAALRCPVHFDATMSSIRFASAFLKAPNQTRNAPHRPLPSSDDAGLASRIMMLASWRCLRGEELSAASIAREFGMSRRTLHRRLAEAGTSLLALTRIARLSSATRLINDTDLSMTQIALAIGYSEPSAFSRAFHAWCGRTPTNLRKPTAPGQDPGAILARSVKTVIPPSLDSPPRVAVSEG